MFKIKNQFYFSDRYLNDVFFFFANSFIFIRFIPIFKNIANVFADWRVDNIEKNKEENLWEFFVEEISPKEIFQFILFMLHIKFLYKDNLPGYLNNKYIKVSLNEEENNILDTLDKFFYALIAFCKKQNIFSGFKEQFIDFLLFQKKFKGISHILDWTYKLPGFFYSWINLNIKILPITILLFLSAHVIFPNISLFFPFSLIFPGQIFVNFLVISLLVSYILFIYLSLFLKVLLNIYQALFFIKNPWIFFIHIFKLPFIIILSILGLTYTFIILIKINPNFAFLGILIFSNFRFFIFYFFYPLLYEFFIPFHREIINYFEKKANENFIQTLRDSTGVHSHTGQSLNQEAFFFHLKTTDEELGYAPSHFSFCLILFWGILVPYKIFHMFALPSKPLEYKFEISLPENLLPTKTQVAFITFYKKLRKIKKNRHTN